MANTIMDKARRDAVLSTQDELNAVAAAERLAATQAAQAKGSVQQWQTSQIAGIWGDQARNEYDLQGKASEANMGSSGYAMAGVVDLRRKNTAAANDVRSQAVKNMSDIANQLANTLAEAANTRKGVVQKRTLLIGQYADRYRQEAEQLALQKEANKIAWYNAKTTRMGADNDRAYNNYRMGLGEDGKPLTGRAKIEGIKQEILKVRADYDMNDQPFRPSEMWNLVVDPTMTEDERKEILRALYPKTYMKRDPYTGELVGQQAGIAPRGPHPTGTLGLLAPMPYQRSTEVYGMTPMPTPATYGRSY